MAERVIVRQDKDFGTQFLAANPEIPDSHDLHPVAHLHDVTPYGMILISLGACTAILLHSYAQNHKINLEWVEIQLVYERNFKNDCDNCENIDQYTEKISQVLKLTGEMDVADYQKLLIIAEKCPIHEMLRDETRVTSRLFEEGEDWPFLNQVE